MVEYTFSSWLAVEKENTLRLTNEKTRDVAVFLSKYLQSGSCRSNTFVAGIAVDS